jgi:hypothetical protein
VWYLEALYFVCVEVKVEAGVYSGGALKGRSEGFAVDTACKNSATLDGHGADRDKEGVLKA